MAQKKSSTQQSKSRHVTAKAPATSRSSSGRNRSASAGTTRKARRRTGWQLNWPQKALLSGIGLILFSFLTSLSLLSPNQGQLTTAVAGLIWWLFGWGGLLFPPAVAALGFYLVAWGMGRRPGLPALRLVGLFLFFLSFAGLASLVWMALDNGLPDAWSVAAAGTGGGVVGAVLVSVLLGVAGVIGAILILSLAALVGTILLSGLSRTDVTQMLNHWFSRLPPEPVVPGERRIGAGRRSQSGVGGANGEGAADSPSAATPANAPAASKTEPVTHRPSTRRSRSAPTEGPAPVAAAPEPIFIGRTGNEQWQLPVLPDMLESGVDHEFSDATIREHVEIIEHTLESFGAPATVVEISQGPTITQYGVEPMFIEQRSGKRTKVKVGKIASLVDDLALALAARSIRIQAPVPGKGYVGIEVPNSSKAMVSLRDVMEATEFQRIQSPLRIGLGQNVAGQPIATDLAAMPHLLIAGTTGSGKSVCVNGIIACLLLQNTPDDLKFVMVDPKRVELTSYNGIPHLVAPVIVDLERVVGTLQWAMREMDSRYQRFAGLGARNIADYNSKAPAKGEEKLPYIVIVIDELADLMMMSPEDTERGITRLAQMARATGIHMVIATQRPSVDVVTGLIKANFPARIAFAVASSTDSRVILDSTGAERLLGQGDMLFQSPDAAAPVRMQGCFVSDRELERIIDYWRGARRQQLAARAQQLAATAAESRQDGAGDTAAGPQPVDLPDKPVQQPLWEELQAATQEAEPADELLPEAVALVRKLGKASTSLLQRRFRIGYTRAARLMDIMEEQGIIGPPTGTSKARELLPANDEAGAEEEDGEAADDRN
jgi:DNA segregation ATPase FtsK/SpoIIIE, S-DNA-T family